MVALSFWVQYLHATGALTEGFWIIAEPLGACTMAVLLGVELFSLLMIIITFMDL